MRRPSFWGQICSSLLWISLWHLCPLLRVFWAKNLKEKWPSPPYPPTFDLALEQIKSLNNMILIHSCEGGLLKVCTSAQHKGAVTEPPFALEAWDTPACLRCSIYRTLVWAPGVLSWASVGLFRFLLARNAIWILACVLRCTPRTSTHFIFCYKCFTATLSQKHWSRDLIHIKDGSSVIF